MAGGDQLRIAQMQALQSNTTLARMDLSENDIGMAALAIARAMQGKQAGRLRIACTCLHRLRSR